MKKYIELFKNIGLFAISNFAIKIVTFLLIPLYTYYLSTVEYGITDMLSTVVYLLIPILTISLSDATLRFCIEDPSNKNTYISIGFFVTIASIFIVCLTLPLLDLSIFGGLGEYKAWFVLCYAVISLQLFFSNVARGINQVSLIVISSVISSAVNIASACLFIAFFRAGISGFFISLFLGNLTGVLVYLIKGKQYRFIKLSSCRNRSIIKTMCQYSLPLVPNALFWWITQSLNRFFISALLGISAVGFFAAASRVPSIMRLVTGVFEQAWNLSAFQEAKSKDKNQFYTTIFRVYNSSLLMITSLLIIFSYPISTFLLKKSFISAWVYIPILLLSFYYSSVNSFFGSIYTASLKTKFLFVTTFAGAAVCLLTNALLIPLFGLQGACVASCLSNFVVCLMRMFDSRRIVKISYNIFTVFLSQLFLILLIVVHLQVGNIFVDFFLMLGIFACVLYDCAHVFVFLKH
uniref:oligosaccharide flippase family protein n=2 Tax=Bifidobacterium TaxID=1678 RepID=UPI00359CABB8